ncbi:MAG: hypothetical protein WCN95_13610 [bacterium]
MRHNKHLEMVGELLRAMAKKYGYDGDGWISGYLKKFRPLTAEAIDREIVCQIVCRQPWRRRVRFLLSHLVYAVPYLVRIRRTNEAPDRTLRAPVDSKSTAAPGYKYRHEAVYGELLEEIAKEHGEAKIDEYYQDFKPRALECMDREVVCQIVCRQAWWRRFFFLVLYPGYILPYAIRTREGERPQVLSRRLP